jgi:hypothetical protein
VRRDGGGGGDGQGDPSSQAVYMRLLQVAWGQLNN